MGLLEQRHRQPHHLPRSTGAVDEAAGSASTRQAAPRWPSSQAQAWHARLQNHAFRHRPHPDSLPPCLPQARQESTGVIVAIGANAVIIGAIAMGAMGAIGEASAW